MNQEPDATLDLRGTACPMNWVRAKLQLESMKPGELLEMLLDDGDAIRNVPMSVREEGHKIIRVETMEGGFRLLVERAGAGPERR